MQQLPDPQGINAWANTLTVVGALLVFILAGYWKWVAWGYQLREKDEEIKRLREENERDKADCRAEAKEWRDLAQTNKQQLDRLLSLFEQRRGRQ